MHHFAQVTFRDKGCFQAVAKEKWGLVLGREDLQQSNPPHSFKNSHCAVINASGGYFEVNANSKPEWPKYLIFIRVKESSFLFDSPV